MRLSRARAFIAIPLVVIFLRCCSGAGYRFNYPDFATCTHTTATPCDVQSALSLPGTSFWQTCLLNRATPLKSAADVLSKDTTLIMQVTEVDYPNPRQTVTTNLTRSVFEEVVRRREELKAQLSRAWLPVLVGPVKVTPKVREAVALTSALTLTPLTTPLGRILRMRWLLESK